MNVQFDFSGKTVLVTGGGSGIGCATALPFGKAGAKVAIADIDDKLGEQVAGLIKEGGGVGSFFHADVADEGAVRGMVRAVVDRFGSLDFAHNNAGIEGKTVPMAELPSDNWRRVVDVNLDSVFYCMKAEIEVMQRAGAEDTGPGESNSLRE
jgi:NAD(P)-dependent dehydrogenase (short-subunit alcohol dehydrogenase family)